MTYWIDVFTAKTWAQAEQYGYKVTGFRSARRSFARRVKPGDIFVCYLGGGISRWVGTLRAESAMYESSESDIWPDDDFSVRFDTRPLVTLTPDTAIPVSELAPRLEMFRRLKNPRTYGVLFQGSPSRIADDADGKIIVDALEAARRSPVTRPVPEVLLSRGSRFIPRERRRSRRIRDHPAPVPVPADLPDQSRAHTEMQYLLLRLGSAIGLDIWVARNDRNRSWGGKRFTDIPRLRESLPEQFDPYTQQIVELIDVLWLERDGIRCAFEVENSTNIYGGVLRMSDLLARRPNLEIRLYLVAPDERREKVRQELNRPTFASMAKPLNQACKFIPYSRLREAIQRWGEDVQFMKPDIIDRIAENCAAQ